MAAGVDITTSCSLPPIIGKLTPCSFGLISRISRHPTVFLSHNKPANSTFSTINQRNGQVFNHFTTVQTPQTSSAMAELSYPITHPRHTMADLSHPITHLRHTHPQVRLGQQSLCAAPTDHTPRTINRVKMSCVKQLKTQRMKKKKYKETNSRTGLGKAPSNIHYFVPNVEGHLPSYSHNSVSMTR
jgi:hypothetical protein